MKRLISILPVMVIFAFFTMCKMDTEQTNYIKVSDLLKIKDEGLPYLNNLANTGLLEFSNKDSNEGDFESLIYDPRLLIDGKKPYQVKFLKNIKSKKTAAIAYSFQKDDYSRFKGEISNLGYKLEKTNPINLTTLDNTKTKVEGIREIFSDDKKEVLIVLEQVGNDPSLEYQSLVNLKIVPYTSNF